MEIILHDCEATINKFTDEEVYETILNIKFVDCPKTEIICSSTKFKERVHTIFNLN